MHERNIYYYNKPDFAQLVKFYPSLKPYIKTNKYTGYTKIDFKDPKANRELTYALLWCDFKLRLEIPLDSLCPAIPGRLDYIHWVEDLLQINHFCEDNSITTTKKDFQINIKGIDIGTGASCIYPLLACRLHPTWKFLAIEIDKRSIEYAKENIKRNYLKRNIKIKYLKEKRRNDVFSFISKKCKNKNYFKQKKSQDNESQKDKINLNMNELLEYDYDFCMCNPPFYMSEMELKNCRELKLEEPHSICTGTESETITEGGEIDFIKKLIDSSVLQYKLRKKYIKNLNNTSQISLKLEMISKNQISSITNIGLNVHWYTSLIGKKSSIEPIEQYLKLKDVVKDIKITEFRQGKTLRWAIAWSFKKIKCEKIHSSNKGEIEKNNKKRKKDDKELSKKTKQRKNKE